MHTELHFSFFSGLLIREYEFISIHQKQLTRTLGVSYFVLKFVGVQLPQYQPLNSILQLKKNWHLRVQYSWQYPSRIIKVIVIISFSTENCSLHIRVERKINEVMIIAGRGAPGLNNPLLLFSTGEPYFILKSLFSHAHGAETKPWVLLNAY